MKADRASRTAQLVALARAMADSGLSHVPDFHDPTARAFLSEKAQQALAGAERAARDGTRGLAFGMRQVMSDMMALRTMAIDAAVRDAMAGGATQLVILGAGYDGRAWRMQELAGARVFEIDHPATQADKRRHVAELPAPIGTVAFVPVDFERESLGSALDRAGHDAGAPTCWIWEGVVMYLTRDAMRATLASMAERSAPASTLIVNYHTAHRRLLIRLILRAMGEPMLSKWTRAEMAADLASAGFTVRDDSGMADWNARFARGKATDERGLFMRIAVATT